MSNKLCDQSISTSNFWIAAITIAIRPFTPASDLHPWSCITNPREKERERDILQGHVNCKVQKSNRLCDQSISTSHFWIAPTTIAIRVFTIDLHPWSCLHHKPERERDIECVCPHVIVSPLPVTRKLLRVKKEEISAAICLGDLPCSIVEPCTRKVFFTTCATKFFHILGTGLHAIHILGEGDTRIRL